MKESHSFHMTPEEFRYHGKKVIDWIADYYEKIESFPVLSPVEPGEIRSQLPNDPPLKGEEFSSILKDMESVILPGVTHWQSPNFFAFFPANASGPSILGDLLSSGLGVQGMIWATSPACTEVETHVLDWLVEIMALPRAFKSESTGGGVIQDTASSAALSAILSAREKIAGFSANKSGVVDKLVAYTSSQTHSSVEKGVKIAGIGADNLRAISVDSTFAMDPQALKQQIKKDKEDGTTPFFVCATIGTTSSNAIDPIKKIGEICKEEGLWLHVDAAMSGTAALCPEFQHLHEGLHLADSYCFNPHKWMFTNFDCNCFFVADRSILIKTMSILPEYLKNKATESGAVIDYRDWHVPLGRRFRALKLWFVLRYYGVEGLQYHIREHVRLAQEFASWIEGSNEFELVVRPPLNLICFRHIAGDEFNRKLMESLNSSGKLYLTHTMLNDIFVLRFSIGQTNTEKKHVERAWELIKTTAKKL